ncbi:MAG TPA: hypothetical protein VII62_00080 [Vicinamibacteria bacterium]|jgi:hypothetical protein
MTHRPTLRAQALGLSLLLVVPPALLAADEKPRPPRPPARVYTNEDLDRVHPFAAETGGSSVPAVAADEPSRARPAASHRKGKGEEHWRAEAARVRERLRALEERAAELRSQIAERGSQSEVFGRRHSSAGKTSVAALQASLAAVERRARLTQEDLEERARRDGALPGWLR